MTEPCATADLPGARFASGLQKRDLLLCDHVVLLSPTDVLKHAPRDKAAELEYLLDLRVVSAFERELYLSSGVFEGEPLARHVAVAFALAIVAANLGAPLAVFDESRPEDGRGPEVLTRLGLQSWRAYEPRLLAAYLEAKHGRRALPLVPDMPGARYWEIATNSAAVFKAFEQNGEAIIKAIESKPIKPDRFGVHQAVRLLVDAWERREEWPEGDGGDEAAVMQVVIESFPEPDDATPWEQVVEFSQSDEVRGARFALRRWMAGVVAVHSGPLEVREELEELLWQYRDSMRIARVATQSSILEMAVTIPGEAAENVLKLRWSRIAEPLFRLRQQRAALLQAERTAPGRAVALIDRAHAAFGSS